VAKLFIGADHAGYGMKEKLKELLQQKRIAFEDCGTYSDKPVDYPDIAKIVAEKVVAEKSQGILLCGSGTGMAIAANKVKGIRAAVAYDGLSGQIAREHNNANILCLGGRTLSFDDIEGIVSVWLDMPYTGEQRHQKRIDKITAMEKP